MVRQGSSTNSKLSENAAAPSAWCSRLTLTQFAYLRAWIEGMPQEDAARHYLGMTHGHELRGLHHAALDGARALAIRAGLKGWRTLGTGPGPAELDAPATKAPDLAQWVASQGLEDWSEAEQLAMYAEAYPPSPTPKAQRDARAARRAKRRRAQLAILARLQDVAAQPPCPSDRLSLWIDPHLAARLERGGLLLLQDVATAAASGRRWWRAVPGFGPLKAQRLTALVDGLLGAVPAEVGAGRQDREAVAVRGREHGAGGDWLSDLAGQLGPVRTPPNRHPAEDIAAIRAWLAAKARGATARSYAREAARWALWCAMERGCAMSCAGDAECVAYMEFLRAIPARWIGAAGAARASSRWAPFRGQLSLASRRQAIKIVAQMSEWLVESGYLERNPWRLVNLSLVRGDERPAARSSRALTKAAYAQLEACAAREAARPVPDGATARQLARVRAAWRNEFLVRFLRHTGLRASEAADASVKDIDETPVGLVLNVVGKGAKARTVVLTDPALQALDLYLRRRGFASLDAVRAAASLGEREDMTPVVEPASATATHAALRRLARHAASTWSDASATQRAGLLRMSRHWLRHTYATRAAEAGVPPDVLQAEMGHADPRTTAGYYTAQLERRVAAMRAAAET